MRRFAPLLVLALLTGCTTFRMTVTSPRGVASKPSNCDFQLLKDAPKSGYEEIAMITHDGIRTSDMNSFKSHIHSDVCSVGGEIVVARIDDHGDIVGGSVYRRDANASNAVSASSGSAPPANDARLAPTN